ncbi:HNH endonuclease [candidate division GN15 bacterium]|nr:HNH endonuclease [candidate division GN15 bacterium]
MKDDIVSYREMCDRERIQTLQRGMNWRLGGSYSVILMSQRSNAPYKDAILEDGVTIIYEGHDVPRTAEIVDPKRVDQPLTTKTGRPTQNGLFVRAVEAKRDGAPAETVRIYEKLFSGIWSYKGEFSLENYTQVNDGSRNVFRFELRLVESTSMSHSTTLRQRSRIIPAEVKQEVWIRDGGKCAICGATDELHFDHDIPYSKGGSSITADNVRILCARHNLAKSDKIE